MPANPGQPFHRLLACSRRPPAEAPSSSSVPIGAIVGAVAGALVLALLAFFAFRPRKGWLRHAAVGSAKRDSLLPLDKRPLPHGGRLAPGMDPNQLSLLPASTNDAELADLPLSYISTAGPGRPAARGGRTSGGASARCGCTAARQPAVASQLLHLHCACSKWHP